jgi:hypothetical protein
MVSGSLKPGDRVELTAQLGGPISAVVRHKIGQLYGFEFVNLSPDQVQRIVRRCKGLANRLACPPA